MLRSRPSPERVFPSTQSPYAHTSHRCTRRGCTRCYRRNRCRPGTQKERTCRWPRRRSRYSTARPSYTSSPPAYTAHRHQPHRCPAMPSVPPTRAAPISLSALPRESVPLASPLASSSKVRLVVCWLTRCPLSPKGGTRGLAPPSCTTKLSMRGYKIWRNFRELFKAEVQRRRIHLLRGWVNKGRRGLGSWRAKEG
jgi:hypothetical protein